MEEGNGRESEVELAQSSCKFVRIEKWPIDFSIDSRQIKGENVERKTRLKLNKSRSSRKFYLEAMTIVCSLSLSSLLFSL